MSTSLRSLLGLSPYVEVLVRKAYWSNSGMNSAAQKLQQKLQRQTHQSERPATSVVRFDDILAFLESSGVSPGGVLVVHSSMAELGKTNLTATSIIDRLREFIGPQGTLAMPAIPRYEAEPVGIERITADLSATEMTYDVKRTLPWTGALPLKLMLRKDSIRSSHPLNSMVALGPFAEEMMSRNLVGDRPLPCGENSSWNFCLQKGAKIVFLGVDVAHSLTMIHVAEDAYVDDWPIPNWYRDRIFRVLDKSGEHKCVVRERHPKWAMHYAERTLARDLLRFGIQKSIVAGGIDVAVIDAQELLAFLNGRKSAGYPYYMWK